MRWRANQSLLVGVNVGAFFVILAALAHVSAGGAVEAWRVGAASLTAISAAAVLIRVRWTFARLIIVSFATQLLMHFVLGPGPDAHHGMTHGSGHHDIVMPASSTEGYSSMPLIHSVVAVLTAMAVRWGWCWLRSMPEVARALSVGGRGEVAPLAVGGERATPRVVMAGAPLAVLLTWGTRGPP